MFFEKRFSEFHDSRVQSHPLCLSPTVRVPHIFLEEVAYCVVSHFPSFFGCHSLSLYFHCFQAAHSEIVTNSLSIITHCPFKEYLILGEDGGEREVLNTGDQNAHGR